MVEFKTGSQNYLFGTMISELPGGSAARAALRAHLFYVIEITRVRKILPCLLGPDKPVSSPMPEVKEIVSQENAWNVMFNFSYILKIDYPLAKKTSPIFLFEQIKLELQNDSTLKQLWFTGKERIVSETQN